ncbi:hypothetical protein B0T24DRAFT_707637 [Lasiosphaeria ovina]|uniref:Cytochrome P450 n=1 Tax=Lasiosphaeria ovina TaxID=92902 RepID=A0AAE0K447_9PEZI|nr:hypothetical protein B0T24DRAFT_707637 [Lasiosphaeria ovina]
MSLAFAATAVSLAILLTVLKAFEAVKVESWLQQHRDIVEFRSAGNSVPLGTRLARRAEANQRLVSAFGIVNSLTSPSVQVHQDFLKTASRVINAGRDNARWISLYCTAETLLRRDISTSKVGKGSGILLADCVRRLCLTVVLTDNFDVDPAAVSAEDVRLITREINQQWLRSKRDPWVTKSTMLNDCLDGLGLRWRAATTRVTEQQTEKLAPEEILGIIMPQYETLWRVVLLTFVTAYHRRARVENVERGRHVPACLGDCDAESEAVKLAKEGLRLNPSNKRIYRATTDAADVEACHRDARIWGPDALEFRPERFDELSSLQERAYYPYSLGKHRCPAISGFGNRMITMLVVALGSTLSLESGRVRYGDERLDGDPGEPLPTNRDDMEGWVFELRS